VLVVAIFAVLSASTVAWALLDKTPPPWDPADHISAAYDYYRPLARLDLSGFYHEFFVEPHYYAPLAHLVTAFVFLIAGASRLTGIVVNLISLAVLIASVLSIDRMLYMRESVDRPRLSPGILAALLAACYHFNAWLLHDAFLDYPLAAVVAASMALLIRAGDFSNRKAALWFGVSAGLGMLTKQTFAFFLLLPSVYAAIRVLVARDRKATINLALAVSVAVIVAAIWYGPHLKEVIEIYRVNQEGAVNENEAPVFSFMSNVFYTHALLSAQTQVPLALLFLFGLVYSLARFRNESVMLYLWIVSGIGMFSIVANKDVRYTVPVLPAVALVSICWLHRNKAEGERPAGRRKIARALKPALAACVAVWALVSFFNAQWPESGMGLYLDTPRFRWMVFARNYYGYDHRPLADDWAVTEITQAMIDLHPQVRARFAGAEPPQESDEPILGVVVNLPYLNPSSFTLYSRLLAPERAGPPLFKIDSLVADSSRDRLDTCQYLLVRTGLDRAEWSSTMERYVEGVIAARPDLFERVASFPIPIESAEAVIYRCKAEGNR
jgi:4-amino-4-deoxy-L-arabinose transferase-like glycosyltransferase